MVRKNGMGLLGGGAILSLIVGAAGSSQPSENASLFVCIAKPGPSWVAGTNPGEWAGRDEHFAFVEQYTKDGTILAIGPFSGFKGGLLIMRAASKQAAESFVKSEPFTQNGYTVWEVRRWLGRFTSVPKKPFDGRAEVAR